MKISHLGVFLLLYLIPWSWVSTKEPEPWFHKGFAWWLIKVKVAVLLIILPMYFLPWKEMFS